MRSEARLVEALDTIGDSRLLSGVAALDKCGGSDFATKHEMNTNANSLIRNVLHAPAMRYRDFRFLCLSAIFDSMGFMGEQVILGWLMLELTESPLMVGAALGLRSVPFFFLGIVAGTIADIVDRRNLMRVLNIGMVIVTSSLGLLALLDMVQVWHLFLLTLIGGSIGALYHTSRQSFAYDIVGPSNLVSGLAYVSLGMRLGGLIGSLSAGFLIANLGPGEAYFLLAAGYVMSAASLTLIQSRGQSAPDTRQPVWQNLKEFGVEIRRNNPLLMLVILVAAVEMVGFSHSAILPSLARDTLHIGADGLGILSASGSIGAVLAIILVSPFGEIRRKGLVFLVVIHIFGGALLLLGFASTFIAAAVIIAVLGGMMALSDLFSQSLVQNVVPNALRGRAMGAWVVGVGTAPVGNLQVGALASVFGVAIALFANGAGLVIIAVATLILYPRLRRL